MSELLLFFEQMPAWQKLAWVMACLAVSWALEGSFPLVQLAYRKWRHAGANFAFLATSLVINATFALGALLVTGAPLAFYVIYRITTIFFTVLTHANVSPPVWLDAKLSWVFVTPNRHKFHHHFERPWTDTNFGGILSIWDRIFGTFVYGDPRQVEYGVDVADPELDEDVWHQFTLPFRRGEGLDRE